MKRIKNRKNVKSVKNVKTNANMDGFEELVNAAKEFKGALDDEVANREYERKKCANVEYFKKFIVVVKSATQETEDAINAKIDETNCEQEKQENNPVSGVESLKAELENLKAHFKGVCAERDWHEQCLKSAENALAYKDKVIDKIKKKNAKRMAEKCEVIAMLNEEIAYQYKRAERAESFIKQLDGACDLIKKHIKAYDSKKGDE